MLRMVFALCLCGGMAGCASMISTLPIVGKQATADEVANVDFEFAVPPRITPSELAALPPGAKVTLFHSAGNSFSRVTGEVLHAGPTGVAMMNVTRQAQTSTGTSILHKVPYIGRLYKNTGVGQERLPVHWVPIDRISTAQLLAPPPEGYVAPQLALDTTSGVEFERIGIDFDFNVEDVPQESETFVLPQISQRHQTVQ